MLHRSPHRCTAPLFVFSALLVLAVLLAPAALPARAEATSPREITADGWMEFFQIGRRCPVQLNVAPTASGVREVAISPDGTRVVFWLATALYSVPVAGGTPVQLNAPFATGTSIGDHFSFSSDSARIVFLARPASASDNKQRLFSVPADGSAPAVTLAEPPEFGALFDEPRMTPAGRLVVFAAERALAGNFVYDLLAVPLAGGSAPVTLTSAAIPATFSVDDGRSRFLVTADSRRVVFRSPANLMFAQYGLQSLAVAELPVSQELRPWVYLPLSGNG
jgi:hypothetical protein